MNGSLYLLLFARRRRGQPPVQPQPETSLLASGGPDGSPANRNTLSDDELLQIAVALITSGALECHR